MMHIMILTQFYPPSLGGMQVSNGLIVESLVNMGHKLEVHVLGRNKSKISKNGRLTEITHDFQPDTFIGHVKTLNLIYQIQSQRKADLMIFLDEGPLRVLGLVPKKMDFLIPTVSINSGSTITRLNKHIKGRINAFLVRRGYKWVSQIFVSSSTAERIRKVEPSLRDLVSTLGRPIPKYYYDSPGIWSWPVIDRLPFLFSSGRAVTYKRIDLVINALKILKDKYGSEIVKFAFAGAGDELSAWKKLADAYNLKKVSFLGQLDAKELIQFYRKCDFFILPTTGEMETFGRVWVEAMANSKPVISNRIDNLSHLIQDGRNAIVVAPDDHSIAEGIDKALKLSLEQYSYLAKGAYESSESYRQDIIISRFLAAVVEKSWL